MLENSLFHRQQTSLINSSKTNSNEWNNITIQTIYKEKGAKKMLEN